MTSAATLEVPTISVEADSFTSSEPITRVLSVESLKLKKEPSFLSSLKTVCSENLYFNIVCLVTLPLGLISEFKGWGETPTFLLNMVAVMCLAKTLDLATDQLAERLGETVGALLNVSFGNFVELIVAVFALRANLLVLVQSSLLGSILSNLLFVLGTSILVGGLKFKVQSFSESAADSNSSLLLLASFAFIVPAAFSNQIVDKTVAGHKVLLFSRAASVLLLIAYVCFLLFQLHTHHHLFNDSESEEEEEEEQLLLNLPVGLGALIVSSGLISWSAEALVGSIKGISEIWGISETFIGLIIIPLVGNAPEHVAAVFAAMRNKMNLSIGIALGSSLQISIFVTPLLVLVGWIIDVPLSLSFPIYDATVVFISILVTVHIVSDGKSNWLEGVLLLLCYFIIAIGYYLIPELNSSI
ncbi:hypothetical protein HDV03_004353 [Kappamyces sp. JEL0829]|nr:hypothetical protein HDV03_004353 [Kappamyces sp. JEL0829]